MVLEVQNIKFHNDKAFYYFRKGKRIEENDKYTLRGSNTELTVRDIKNTDAGPYYCEAKNKAGKVTNQTFLQVFGKYCLVSLPFYFLFPFGNHKYDFKGKPVITGSLS